MKNSKCLLSVLLACAASLSAQSRLLNIASFGAACGADLVASPIRTAAGVTLRFELTSAAPASVAVLVAGQQTVLPLPLPNTNCGLLVQPRATFIALVDAAGSAAFRFPVPSVAPVTLDFQVVTLALARNGRTAESSNGVRVTIQ
ncbi:MAG: hypothetical protein EXS02_14805 [Planctomycetes bacterium]|nr:hypothetical protein [Planctomycetota bacterium]